MSDEYRIYLRKKIQYINRRKIINAQPYHHLTRAFKDPDHNRYILEYTCTLVGCCDLGAKE